jgi:hypothetical protein
VEFSKAIWRRRCNCEGAAYALFNESRGRSFDLTTMTTQIMWIAKMDDDGGDGVNHRRVGGP